MDLRKDSPTFGSFVTISRSEEKNELVERGVVIRYHLTTCTTIMYTVRRAMEVISFRIPEELKQRLKEVDLNWSEEMRRFIEERVREYKREKALREIDALLKDVPSPESGTAARYVREDRESH
jgi:hypothetical protein